MMSGHEQDALDNVAGDVYAFPLSFAQQRLWFLDQLEPGSSAYNLSDATRIRGVLDLTSLEQSLNEIIRRHEALRTTFSLNEGNPVQIVIPTLTITLPVVDLTEHEESMREAEAQRLVSEEALRPFDLSCGPLFRALIIRLSEHNYILLLTFHHIVSDGWSLDVFYHELTALYQAFIHNEPSPLPELSIQYADYTLWQREWLKDEVLENQLAYWKEQLRGLQPLRLPTDHPRPAVQSYHGAREVIELSSVLTQSLYTLCRHEGATLFMTLLAAFQTLLARCTGQEDIVVGSPIAGRTRQEVEGLLGFFVNTLVLRTDLSGNPTFRELLSRVRQMTLAAYEHQELPFEKLVEEVQPERNLSYSPLFQILFNMVNGEAVKLELAGTTTTPFISSQPEAKFDLTLYIKEENQRVILDLVYNTELFRPSSVTCLLQQYRYLLEQIVNAPDRSIWSYSLVTPESRHLLPDASVPLAEPPQQLVMNLFDSWVKKTPNQCAIRQGTQQWTYAELAERVYALARVLRAQGLQSGEVVAVHGERSFGLIVSMLATLLSGGVMLPLDSNLPNQRKRLICKEANVKKTILVGRDQPDEAWWGTEMESDVLHVDAEHGKALDEVSTTPPDMISLPELTPDAPAYVFFTSGTTGIPKGVLGVHKGLSHFLDWQRDTFNVIPADSVAQLTSLSFDAILREIFLPLTSGATLCLPERSEHFAAADILGWLEREHISIVQMVPSVAQSCFAYQEGNITLPHVRVVFSMGEPLSDTLVRRWREALPREAQIVNLYGPTETTLVKCFYCVPLEVRPGVQPIGTPMPQTQALILGKHNQLCGINEPGEIVLRTPFRSLGYINAPEENEKRFVKNPFRDDAYDLLYFTGDGGRYTSDGTLEIFGRLDDQVKIRGVRIEPAEITALLSHHPAVESCFVTAYKDELNETSLVAYVVAAKEPSIHAVELRSYLAGQVPAALVPTAFVFLNSFPLTANGKVDRKALPVPEPNRGEFREGFVAPRTPLEDIVAAVWREVLSVAHIGIRDNFFALGGHSLNATQVMARLRSILHIELSLRIIFESPTIAGLAERIEEHRHQGKRAEIPPIQLASRDRLLPLSFAQQRLWFLDQLEPGSSVYNITDMLRLHGPLDVAALEQSINAIIQRHEALRTTFVVYENEPIQLVTPALNLPLHCIDLRDYAEGDRETHAQTLAQEEAQRPFDLACGPLLRVTLFQLGGEEHLLLLIVHHIVADGWSLDVLLHELAQFYHAFHTEQPASVPALAVQYADYALWQREWLQGEVLEKQLDYWMTQLLGAPPVLNLPLDHPRPARQSFQGARELIEISPSLTQALQTVSRREGVTLFMTLLAAFQTLLYRYTGQEDLVVGAPIAGRARQEVERLIGFFVNTLVFRTDLSGNPSFRELLGRVRDVTLGAYAHQELPFEKLVEALQPERSLSYSPVFQVLFALYNGPSPELQLDNLTVSSENVERTDAKFDLTLSLREEQDGLRGWLEYNTDLFAPSTIKRLLGHFYVLLEGIVAQPTQRLSELPILTEVEKNQLLVDWNETTKAYNDTQCVHQLFESQVELTPDTTALVHDEQRLTYHELNTRANQLAHYLRTLGIGSDVLVGLCLERSVELVISILAILKAGGAYVPLDPTYPSERLAFILQDSQASLLVTQQRLCHNLPHADLPVLCVDTDYERFAQEPNDNLDCNTTPHDLAYVFYTSGSTGKPKGVAVEHRNSVAFLAWATAQFSSDELAGVLASTSICFDLSIFEIFTPLICGGTVILAENALALPTLSRASRLTLLNTVPSAMRELLRLAAIPSSVLVISLGGELVRTELVEQIYATTPVQKVYDLYGPTECTTYSTWAFRSPNGPYTIGRPIANTQAYILDRHHNPVPIGVAGELHLGGDGVARGYLHRPEITAEKFIPDFFSTRLGARLYRTGDLARYLPDGNIEFLGRIDHQVKIRGYRIELGEIEATLVQHPGVREAVVVVREDPAGDKQIVAYLALNDGLLTSGELRAHLATTLPAYMVPNTFVFLDALPLTPNGKVDRKALPVPIPLRNERDQAYIAPRTATEKTLARIWSEVLGVQQISIHDNFFDLGGHSLKVTQVVARIRTTLDIELPLQRLFEAPTIAGLAGLIDQDHAPISRQPDLEQLVADIENLSDEEAALALAQLQNSGQ